MLFATSLKSSVAKTITAHSLIRVVKGALSDFQAYPLYKCGG